MHAVLVRLSSADTTPNAAFARLTDLPRLPSIAPAVISVAINPANASESSWRAHFGSGELRWVQRDDIDSSRQRYGFRAIGGDVPVLFGEWAVDWGDPGTVASFSATFDLGMPALADQLHPVAAAALIQGVESIMRGALAEDATLLDARHAPAESAG